MNPPTSVKYLRFEEKLPLDFETKVQTLARSHPMEFKMYLQIVGAAVLMELTDCNNPQNELCIDVKCIRDDKTIKTAIRTCIAHFKISECRVRIGWQLFATIKGVMTILKGTRISSLHMEHRKETGTNPESILDVFRNVPEVRIVWNTQGYCPKIKVKPFQFERLLMENANWVTIKHLTNMFIDCKHIKLNGCAFTNSEIKAFLKKWMDGSSLRKIETGISKVNFNTVMKGLGANPVKAGWLGEKEGGCYRMKQKNGLEVFVYRDPGFTLTTKDLLTRYHFTHGFGKNWSEIGRNLNS